MYEGEGCGLPDGCSEGDLAERIYGNPIYAFQTARRLVTELGDVLDVRFAQHELLRLLG